MIGIDMELPKGCNSCPLKVPKFIKEAMDWIDLCPYTEEVIIGDEYENKRCDKGCPLVDLGSEDMSWEELVEKVKELKSDLLTINEDYIRYRSFAECWDCLEFGIDNQIIFKYMDEQKVIHTDKSFFQMYQIIKSLVGDQK